MTKCNARIEQITIDRFEFGSTLEEKLRSALDLISRLNCRVVFSHNEEILTINVGEEFDSFMEYWWKKQVR